MTKNNFFTGKSVVVTGGAGFIGSHLSRRLIKEGANVHLFLRVSTDRTRISDILSMVTVHDVDITRQDEIVRVLSSVHPNGVFHLAAVNQSFGNIPTIESLVAANILATIQLMDAMNSFDYEFFVNTSTFAEIGSKDHPIREDDLPEPKEFYGVSRIPATFYGETLGRELGKPIETIRVFTPYGPAMQKGKLVHGVIESALIGRTISLTKPEVTRDLIYIDDLIDLYLTVAERAKEFPGAVWNGGSGVATTLNELTQTVLELTESSSLVEWSGKDVSYDRARWQADMTKVKQLLGFAPAHNLYKGIEKTITWYKKNTPPS